MCGLNGFNFYDPKLSEAMTLASIHRGRDHIGTFADSDVTLTQNLLAIRGAAVACHQPMQDAGSDWVLSFVGEIYNTDKLKSTYVPHVTTQIDTHILYAVIQKLGWNFIRHVQGMYAIALYNRKERLLRLYRDPSGQKCIYYYFKHGKLVFSSEIRPLTKFSGIQLEIDEHSAISVGPYFGYLPFNHTIFKDIYKLQMGEILTYDVASGKIGTETIASPPKDLIEEEQLPPAKALSSFIRQHFASEVPLALNLSGGMDSSVLLQELVESGREFEAFTTYFDGDDSKRTYNEEFELAARLCKHYAIKHRGIRITKQDYLDTLEKSWAVVEEPNYNIGLPVYYRMAQVEGVQNAGYRVVLSGDGGDEVFSGYPHHRRAVKIDRARRLLSTPLFNWLMKRRHPSSDIDFGNAFDLYLYLRSFGGSNKKLPHLETQLLSRKSLFAKPRAILQEMLLADRIVWMSAENSLRSDKIYMSQSIELRAPFCYHPLRLYFDARLKTADYLDNALSKKLLRSLYKDRLPDFVVQRRRKWGWRPPLSLWFDETVRQRYLDIIESATHSSGGLIDWQALRKRIELSTARPDNRTLYFVSLAATAKSFGIRI